VGVDVGNCVGAIVWGLILGPTSVVLSHLHVTEHFFLHDSLFLLDILLQLFSHWFVQAAVHSQLHALAQPFLQAPRLFFGLDLQVRAQYFLQVLVHFGALFFFRVFRVVRYLRKVSISLLDGVAVPSLSESPGASVLGKEDDNRVNPKTATAVKVRTDSRRRGTATTFII